MTRESLKLDTDFKVRQLAPAAELSMHLSWDSSMGDMAGIHELPATYKSLTCYALWPADATRAHMPLLV
jgi:hypothetical protein